MTEMNQKQLDSEQKKKRRNTLLVATFALIAIFGFFWPLFVMMY